LAEAAGSFLRLDAYELNLPFLEELVKPHGPLANRSRAREKFGGVQ